MSGAFEAVVAAGAGLVTKGAGPGWAGVVSVEPGAVSDTEGAGPGVAVEAPEPAVMAAAGAAIVDVATPAEAAVIVAVVADVTGASGKEGGAAADGRASTGVAPASACAASAGDVLTRAAGELEVSAAVLVDAIRISGAAAARAIAAESLAMPRGFGSKGRSDFQAGAINEATSSAFSPEPVITITISLLGMTAIRCPPLPLASK